MNTTAMIRTRRLGPGDVAVFADLNTADHGDDPAIALYTRLGIREEVLHFDIALGDGPQ